MPDMTFENDPFSRTLIRGLLLLQPTTLVLVLGLSYLDLSYLAVPISFLALCLLLSAVLCLYLRYRKIPIVREKRKLQDLRKKLQKKIQAEGITIRAAVKQRKDLSRSEKEEINTALRMLQRNYIEHGLASALIEAATIPGMEPELRERLAGSGILSAAQVNDGLAQLQGFGEAKRQALIGWQSKVLTRLESTKPVSLPNEQLKTIKTKFQALHDQNNTVERTAIDSKQTLEHELTSLKLLLEQLASITFRGYLSKSLVSRGMLATLIAFLLIATQVLSSVSAAGSAILASIPTGTPTSRVILTASVTPTLTSTIPLLPTIRNTPSAGTYPK